MSTCVMVFGARGFIGRNIVRHLRRHHLDKVHTFAYSRDMVDLQNYDEVAKCFHLIQKVCFEKVVVFICAGVGGKRLQADGEDIIAMNMKMVENVMKCEDMFTKVVLFGSGAAFGRVEYGTPQHIRGVCHADLVELPPSAFETNKCCEHYDRAKCLIEHKYGEHPKCIHLRIFGCYGEDQEPQRFHAVCQENATVEVVDRYFDFVSVDDVVRVCAYIAEDKGEIPQHLNLCYQHKKKLSQIACELGCIPIISEKQGCDYTGKYEAFERYMI